MNTLNRRGFLKQGARGAAIAALAATFSPRAAAEEKKPIRIGVVGLGSRGRGHIQRLFSYFPNVEVPAVCDYRKERAALTVELVKKMKGYAPESYTKDEYDYRNMAARDDLDGVLTATDAQWNGKMSIDVMRAGKHVSHEVPGCCTLEECEGLVKAHQETGKHCMLLENCSYGEANLRILNMVRAGVLGDPYFAVGSYIHDCRSLFFDSQGKITWRGELWRDNPGCSYNSHALGSPSKWLGINDGDRFVSCSCTMSRPAEAHEFSARQFGPESEPAKTDFKTGDFVTTLIRTAKGRQIRIDYSLVCSRPYARYYLLQGMKGCYDSRTGLYLGQGGVSLMKWGSIDDVTEKWQHPYWRKDGPLAIQAGGHGGIDYFCLRDFVKMVRTGEPPWIDAYDCAAWSSIFPCSTQSLEKGGAPVDVPDFTKGKWKSTDWRSGRMV